MKCKGVTGISLLVMLLALATAALAAEKGFLWDGTQWKDMTKDIKVAYVKGIGNMADFENAAGGPAGLRASPRVLSMSSRPKPLPR